MVADHWFMQVEKVLEAMEITSDMTKIRLAAFQLEGEAQVWWNWAKTSKRHGQNSKSCSCVSSFQIL